MGWFDEITDTVKGFVNKVTGAVSNATGFSNASNFTPYKEFEAPQVDINGLSTQISNNANLQKQQNVSNYNAAMASQAGVNPALAASFMGNNLANTNQQIASNTNNLQAQAAFQGNLANMQSQYQTHALNSGNYNAAMSGNAMAAEKAADRGAGFLGGLFGGIGGAASSLAGAAGGGGAAVASDERMKEAPDANDYGSHFHHYFTGKNQQMNGGQGVGPLQKPMSQSNTSNDSMAKNAPRKLSQESDTIESFLDTLTPYEYKYKPGTIADDGGETHMGVMAQNLEKTQVGDNAVMDTQYGKMVDIKQLSSLLAAGMGNIHERLSRIEGKRNG